MLPNLIFLDTETTGLGPDDRLIQLACVLTSAGQVKQIHSHRFNPGRPIGFEAMAVHHVTEEMVKGSPTFKDSARYAALNADLKDHVLVAHNAPFDVGMLTREGIEQPKWVIDTRRVAMHLITTVDRHALQYLRYALDLNSAIIEKHPEITAHDALSDVYVLMELFDYLLIWTPGEDEKQKVKKMIELSTTPVLLRKFGFGKYAGSTFEKVKAEDRSYLLWLYDAEKRKPAAEKNEDLLYTLNFYLHG